MDQDTLRNFGIVFAFLLIGGVFAATEIALVTLRESQISQLEQHSRRGERIGRLARDPNRFLSAVQIGVTVAGFMSAAYGASLLAPDLGEVLVERGMPSGVAETVAIVVMTLFIAYLSLVFAELVPKRIALQRAAGVSRVVAPPLDRFATLMRPVIWFLSKSTDLVVRLLGGDPNAGREEMTEAELRELVAGYEGLGEEERTILDEVFEAGGHQIREVMRPRTEVDFLDADLPVDQAVKKVYEMPHSRYPVVRGSSDDVVGFVHVRDLLNPERSGRDLRLRDLTRDVLVLPTTKHVLPAMFEMRREGVHLAVVVDEYGGTSGIVTLEDLVEELVGDIRDEYDEVSPAEAEPYASGVIDLDGLMNLADFQDKTGVELATGPYETVGGYVTSLLARMPELSDVVEVAGRNLEVIELDGRRASRLRLHPADPREAPTERSGERSERMSEGEASQSHRVAGDRGVRGGEPADGLPE